MEARIKDVEKLGTDTKLTFIDNIPFSEVIYTEEEYNQFRTKVLAFVEIKKLKQLIGLTFEWETISGKLYPTKLILPKNPILVDVTEPKEIFGKLLPLSVWDNIDCDYCFNGYGDIKITIERKNSEDLISSILSGHLSEQIQKMPGDVRILLIEDFLTCTSQLKVRTRYGVKNISWNFIWNYLQTAQRDAGILLDSSTNMNVTPLRIKSLYKNYQEPEHKSLRAVMLPNPKLPKPIRTLMTFGGYSQDTAIKVLKEFKTLRNYFNADVKEREIPGIGPVKANEIDSVLDMEVEDTQQ